MDSDPEQFLLHLERLSTLALNQVVKVSLNLSSFFKRFETDSEGAGFKTLFQLSSALQVSKRSLREICLTLEVKKEKGQEDYPQVIPFLTFLIRSLRSFSRLELVRIEGPIGALMRLGEEVTGSKIVRIINHKNYTNQGQLPLLMKEVKELTGTGFTEFEALLSIARNETCHEELLEELST